MADEDRAAALAEWKRLFAEKVQKGVESMRDPDERSQFITEEKHNSIKECVTSWGEWGKEERKQQQQGYAWVKKYAIISTADGNSVLIYQPKQPELNQSRQMELQQIRQHRRLSIRQLWCPTRDVDVLQRGSCGDKGILQNSCSVCRLVHRVCKVGDVVVDFAKP